MSNTEPYCVKEELARLQHELQEQKAGSSALQDKLNVSISCLYKMSGRGIAGFVLGC